MIWGYGFPKSGPKSGVPFWDPHNKESNVLGFVLGSPYFRKLPYPPPKCKPQARVL